MAQALQGGLASYYACEIAYWLAGCSEEPEEARQWLERAGPDADPQALLRAQAAVALAIGQKERAESLVIEGLAKIAAPPLCGSDAFEQEQLAYLERQMLSAPTLI